MIVHFDNVHHHCLNFPFINHYCFRFYRILVCAIVVCYSIYHYCVRYSRTVICVFAIGFSEERFVLWFACSVDLYCLGSASAVKYIIVLDYITMKSSNLCSRALFVDTSAGGLLVAEGIIRPVVSVSALTWFNRYIVYVLLKFTVSK